MVSHIDRCFPRVAAAVGRLVLIVRNDEHESFRHIPEISPSFFAHMLGLSIDVYIPIYMEYRLQ